MRNLRPILLASFFFSLHGALTAYINSSMLGELLTPKATSLIFILGSVLSLLMVGRAAKLVEKWGNVRYMATVLSLSAALLFGIGIANGHWTSALLFIPYFALGSLVYYGFDVFLEHVSDPKKIGNTRGLFLTLNNLAWIGMPAFVGFLESRYGFGVVYFFAAFAVLTALVTMLLGERHYRDAKYTHFSFRHALSVFREKGPARSAILVNGLLQLFYVWMVIYSPLYLTRTLGLHWETVGLIFSIMLIPFVLFQYPVGRIADKFGSERILIAGGLLIMGLATIIFSLVGDVGALAIALILFLTRMGASIVEVSNESYFFKHVTDRDTPTIAVYRNMMPLAYAAGPLLAIVLLGWSMYAVLFFILGAILVTASAFSLSFQEVKKE